MTSHRHFFDVVLLLLSSLVTGPSFMTISSLVLSGVMKIFFLYPPLSFAQYLEANAVLLLMKLCDLLQGLSKINFKSKNENTQCVSQ